MRLLVALPEGVGSEKLGKVVSMSKNPAGCNEESKGGGARRKASIRSGPQSSRRPEF